uniref:FH2 domain-containing protein n=1 Tax=Octopus bimaculoides TaxID=37653 RepID=A0A0L8HL97_OCTBM
MPNSPIDQTLLWEELDETSINFDEFDELFSKPPADKTLRSKAKSKPKADKQPCAFYSVNGGHGFGSCNEEGTRLLVFCDVNNLMICNTNFRKPASHLIVYQSGGQASQYRLVISNFRVQARMVPRSRPVRKRKIWKLKNPLNSQSFRNILIKAFNEEEEEEDLQTCNIEDNWKFLWDSLLRATEQIRGWCKVVNTDLRVVKLLDSKRSQALGIFLSSLRLEMADIENAILSFDTSLMDLEKLKTLYDIRGEKAELQKIEDTIAKNPDVAFDKPEQFLHDLNQIPDYAERIFCSIFQSTFQESISVLENKLNNLKMTCEAMVTGVSIRRILSLVLTMGNYMNGGHMKRGQADGFGLEILSKLKDVKSKDNRTSLLQYVVKEYVQRYEQEDAGTDKVALPLPDPSDINQATLVNFEDILVEMGKIEKDFQSAETRSDKVMESSGEKFLQPFKDIMTEFFIKGRQELKDQQENLRECQNKFDYVVKFYCVKPKSGEKTVTPVYFFSLWMTFCKEFKDFWKKEQQIIVKQSMILRGKYCALTPLFKRSFLQAVPPMSSSNFSCGYIELIVQFLVE